MLAGEGVPVAATSRQGWVRVLAVGDSLLAEAHPDLVRLGAAHGLDISVHAVGGTAPCDWVEPLDALLPSVEPDLVLFSFSGNDLTGCMADAPIGSDDFYERYDEAAAELTARSVAGGSEVWWMEVLPFGTETAERQRAPLDGLFRDAPGTSGLIPTRALFESDTGGFATEASCRFVWEPCDSLRVRADDGVHLGSAESPYGPLRYAVSILSFIDCWTADRKGSR